LPGRRSRPRHLAIPTVAPTLLETVRRASPWVGGEGSVSDSQAPVLCPTCHAVVQVVPDWRLVQCPRCGGMLTRMSEDRDYD